MNTLIGLVLFGVLGAAIFLVFGIITMLLELTGREE